MAVDSGLPREAIEGASATGAAGQPFFPPGQVSVRTSVVCSPSDLISTTVAPEGFQTRSPVAESFIPSHAGPR